MDSWDIVIIGGGIAGLSAARELKKLSPAVRLLVISAEPELPYKRTKLSKTIVQPATTSELLIEPESFYDQNGVDLMPDTLVEKIDTSGHVIFLSDGARIEYGKALIATGAVPMYPQNVRRHDLGDFYVLRNQSDFNRLRGSLGRAKSVLVSGMGVLGVEVSEQLQLLGKRVTLMGTGPQVMSRYLSLRASEILEKTLNDHHIELRYQEEVLSFERNTRGTLEITTLHGQTSYDMLVFCIGARPDVSLARNSGIRFDKGIIVDSHLKTSAEDVFAAGDVAQHQDGFISHLWHAAEFQGISAAQSMMGEPRIFEDPGFRLKCEVFGTYIFSFYNHKKVTDCRFIEMEKEKKYLGAFVREGRVAGLIMANDKEQNKKYEQAVREQWSIDQVGALL